MSGQFQPRSRIGTQSLQEHLRSPCGLSEKGLSEITQLVKVAEDDLDGYHAEILRLEARIVYLKSEHDRLVDHKSTLSSLLSPIHRLPNEIMIRIFTFSCDQNTLGHSKQSHTLDVSAVCSRWRALTLSCSELWATFSIILPPIVNERHDPQLLEYILDIFLERSKHQLLTISIDAYGSSEHPLLHKVMQTSPRWRDLTLNVDVVRFSAPLHSCLIGLRLPELQSACIVQPTGYGISTLDLLSGAPKLRDLHALSLPLSWTNPHSLSQITHLSYCPSFTNFYELLDWCPQLKTLYLSNFEHDRDIRARSIPAKQVPITSLTVSLAGYYPMVQDILLDSMESLVAPALTSLVLEQHGELPDNLYAPPSPFNAVDSFLARSACPLTVLVLDSMPLTDCEVVALLKRLPSLVELTVTESKFENALPITLDFVESLHSHKRSALRSSVNPILPKLQTLVLEVQVTASEFEREGSTLALIDVIVSRWLPEKSYAASIGVSCLRSVELYLLGPPRPGQFQLLEPYDKSGLRFVVGESRDFEYR
ncbi:hypothetical protein F5879DRAFT_980309 [Lentinula edodes]|nr:hypothetical protein F5879DRAFT_980309 [Lentinula edodes]